MGKKAHPIGLRIGINKTWGSSWYASNKDYSTYLIKDIKIREYLEKTLKDASVSNFAINRNKKRTEIKIFSSKPGLIIGRGSEDIEKLRNAIKKLVDEEVYITVIEVRKPDLDASIVADSIAHQIENRANYRNAQKKAIKSVMKAGAKGVKTAVSGRLNGVERARTEGYSEGTVPLHTLRANIDYATKTAITKYGKIGVKVWIYKGEVLNNQIVEEDAPRERNRGDHDVNAKKN